MGQKKYYIFFGAGILVIISIVVLAIVDTQQQRNKRAAEEEKRKEALGLTAEARAQFEERRAKAIADIAKDPKRVGQYLELAVVEKALGNSDAAVAALVRAGQIAPTNYLVFANLGMLYMEKGMNKEAEIVFARAIRYGPKDVVNYVQYVEFLQYRYPERRADILATFAQGLQEMPGEVELLRARATYYRDVGDDVHALLDWKAVLAKEPKNDAVREEIRALEQRLKK